MATYLIARGCLSEEEIDGPEARECAGSTLGEPQSKRVTGAGTTTAPIAEITGLRGCGGKKTRKVVDRKWMKEEDLRQLLSRQIEEAQVKEREAKLRGLADGRMAYLKKTHYTFNWRETGRVRVGVRVRLCRLSSGFDPAYIGPGIHPSSNVM